MRGVLITAHIMALPQAGGPLGFVQAVADDRPMLAAGAKSQGSWAPAHMRHGVYVRVR